MENSTIEWTDHTFNPWIGCTHVHEGCRNCYAETLMDTRYGKVEWGPTGTRVLTSPAYWKNPIAWNRVAQKTGKRARVFCASLADVFEEWTGRMYETIKTMDEVRYELFQLIDNTPWLDWILLTKRPQNVPRMWRKSFAPDLLEGADETTPLRRQNVWILTSISDQASADKQIPELLKCRDLVTVLGVSAEPLLGPLKIYTWLNAHVLDEHGQPTCSECGVATNRFYAHFPIHCWQCGGKMRSAARLDWVICGGESGHHARPMHPDWARSLRDECQAAGVAFFHKQNGEYASVSEVEGPGEHYQFHDGATVRRVGKKLAGRTLDGRTWDEMPGQ